MAETSETDACVLIDDQLRVLGWEPTGKSQFRTVVPISAFGVVAATGRGPKALRASASGCVASSRWSFNVFANMQRISVKLIVLIFGANSASNFSAINSLIWVREVCFNRQKRDSSRLDGLGVWQHVGRRSGSASASDICVRPTICSVRISLVPQLRQAILQNVFARVG